MMKNKVTLIEEDCTSNIIRLSYKDENDLVHKLWRKFRFDGMSEEDDKDMKENIRLDVHFFLNNQIDSHYIDAIGFRITS